MYTLLVGCISLPENIESHDIPKFPFSYQSHPLVEGDISLYVGKISEKHFFVHTKNGPLFPLLYYSLILLLIIHKNRNRHVIDEKKSFTEPFFERISYLFCIDSRLMAVAVVELCLYWCTAMNFRVKAISWKLKHIFMNSSRTTFLSERKKTYNSLMLVENGLNPQWTERREHYIESIGIHYTVNVCYESNGRCVDSITKLIVLYSLLYLHNKIQVD